MDERVATLERQLADERGRVNMLRSSIDALGDRGDARRILRSAGVRLAVDCLKSALERRLAELEADSGTDEDDGLIAGEIEDAEKTLADLRVYLEHVGP